MSHSHGKHSSGYADAATTLFLAFVLQNLYLATDVRGSNLTRGASVGLKAKSVVPVVAGCAAGGGMDCPVFCGGFSDSATGSPIADGVLDCEVGTPL